jgi:predicted AlkP superfamily phosphohydrolase/phosphomutase
MKKIKMKLVGLDGNAFSLMGTFRKKAREQGWNKDEIDNVIQECMSGDYNHLLATLMEHTE